MKNSIYLLLALLLALGSVWAQDDEVADEENAITEETTTDEAVAEDDVDFKVPPRGQEATIDIVTSPPGSIVYLDGEELGKTPIHQQFRTGRHDLVIVDQGQELENMRFNVWPGKVNKYSKKTVMPFGKIEITTNPKRCDIYLDGELADMTDGGALTIHSIDAGDHVVEAVCGRRRKDVMVTVPGESTVTVHLDVFKKNKK